MHRQLPELLQTNERSSRYLLRLAPLIDGFFRPEEEHGRSGKNKIVPPMRRRDREMRDIRLPHRRTVFHFKSQRLAGMSIDCATDRIAVQGRSNTIGIPDAIRVIAPTLRFHWKRGRHTRERWRHANTLLIAGFRKDQTLGMQATKRGPDFLLS